MQLPVKAKIKFQVLIDAEQSAQDNALVVSRRLSSLSKSLATAPASEAALIEAELDRLRHKMDDAQSKHRFFADLNARLRHFLDSIEPAHLEDIKPKAPKVEKGETLGAAAAQIRGRIAALTIERQKLLRAGMPAADAKKLAAEHVGKLAERGRPKLRFAHDEDFKLSFDAMVPTAHTPVQDIGAALAWLDPTALLNKIYADIDAMPKPPFAMSAKARADKLGLLEIELLNLEFADEAIVEASEVDGPIVRRRHEADARSVLGIIIYRGKPAPAKTVAKVKRHNVTDIEPANASKRMTQAELIKAFGANHPPSAASE